MMTLLVTYPLSCMDDHLSTRVKEMTCNRSNTITLDADSRLCNDTWDTKTKWLPGVTPQARLYHP
jgi:hypothetical protein